MNIDLKTENPQAAVEQMCGLSDSELDRVAANQRGFKAEHIRIAGIEFDACILRDDCQVHHIHDYSPSTDLNQAMTLLLYAELELSESNITWDSGSFDGLRFFDWKQEYEDGSRLTVCRATVPKAGTIARAVTILACVGLLFGGGK